MRRLVLTIHLFLFLFLALVLGPTAVPSAHAADDYLLMTMSGDSILQGTTAARASETLTGRLARIRPSWFIRNYGVAGASVSGSPLFPAMNPHAIVPLLGSVHIVLLGTNDYGYDIPLDSFRTNYGGFLDVLGFLRPFIVCVTPIWRSDELVANDAGAILEEYRTAIRDECRARGLAVIDGSVLVPHDPRYYEPSFGISLHPNSQGYRHFATNLARRLDELL